MRLVKYFFTAAMLFVSIIANAKYTPKTIYVFGFAASFNDSTVYISDIQQLDSAYIDSKTNFLYSRENYSYQLRDYLAAHGMKNATCITSFALKRKDAEKKYLKMRKRYLKGGNFQIKTLESSEFKFDAIPLPKEGE